MHVLKAWLRESGSARALTDGRAVLALFTATIFLSAALLFSVQPMFAKMVLPALGGSPSVWAVSMCFFQAVLLAGYCYAHTLNTCLSPRNALLVHAVVLTLATLALPIALPDAAREAPAGNTYLWLIGILVAGVGLPFFAVSANAPLLQSWFARSGHPHASDPYFLYGASNIGSLLALVSYPILVEPGLGLGKQGALWTAGFVALAGCIMASGLTSLVREGRSAGSSRGGGTCAEPVPVAGRERVLWVALAFVPSALLVGFTTVLTTDIASAPLLWVMPLALFLLTFVMVFRDEPVVPHNALVDRQAIIAALAIFGTASVSAFNWAIAFFAALSAFLVTSLVCHRELYLRRPPAGRLTEFYLWMSFGGVLGGVFSAIVAPQLFTSVFEFPLLVALGLLARPGSLASLKPSREVARALVVAGIGIAGLAALGLLISAELVPGHPKLRIVIVSVLMGAMMLLAKRRAVELSCIGLMLATIALVPEGAGPSHAVRSFFGVHRVVESGDGNLRLLMHGTTVHGAERKKDAEGRPVEKPVPATYYHPAGPMARSLDLVRTEGRLPRIGVVGLGAGSMACHAMPGETWRFFEIDQAVVDLARDGAQFGFLSRCQPAADVVLGDARLTLAAEKAGSFDYLLIDAFSSDAIPTHLLTIEAMRLYLGKLKPDGVLAIHVSNRHLDLKPVVAANAAVMPGLETLLIDDRPDAPGFDAAPSEVVLMSRSPARLAPARAWRGRTAPAVSEVAPWTDDYSDVMSAIVRGWAK